MGKIKKFTLLNIKKIAGGKEPLHIIEEFILRLGHDPDTCLADESPDHSRWMIQVSDGEVLEMLLEGKKKPSETTIYMGINITTVPLRGAAEMLTAALEVADGLVGIKVSLVGHFLVLSSSLGASGLDIEELDYHYRLIVAQQSWFRDALADELGWEELPK